MIQDSADFELAYEMQLSEALRASTSDSSMIQDSADFELAYEMQLSEALRASTSVSSSSPKSATYIGGDVDAGVGLNRRSHRVAKHSDVEGTVAREDSDFAFAEQVLELGRLNQEMEDDLIAAFFVDAHHPEGKSYLATNKADLEDTKLVPRCSICTEERMGPRNSLIVSNRCKHRFCVKCLQQYAEVAVKNGKSRLTCPEFDCKEVCSNEILERLLSSRTYVMLTQRQVEESIPVSERVYCPFRDCSALQLKPTLPEQASSSRHPHKTAVGGVECYKCHRQFCLECKVPWHDDLTCAEFQAIPSLEREPDDLRLKALAQSEKWQRCSRCRYVVELTTGCDHITCRCGYHFCYTCGGTWTGNNHVCRT